MPLRNLSLIFAALCIGILCAAHNQPNPYSRYVSHGYQLIDDYSLFEPDDEELFEGAMQGMVQVLKQRGDIHSDYLRPSIAKPLRDEMRQEFGGVGIRIRMDEKPRRLIIAEPPIPGTPAYRAKLRKGDIIEQIDRTPILPQEPLDKILSRMRGKPGSSLVLTINREGRETPFDVELVREIIKLPSLIGDRRKSDGEWEFRLLSNPKIAHLRLISFGNHSVEEIDNACRDLISQGVRGVVLDMRNNPGGSLDAAVLLSDLFLPTDSPIVSIRGRDQQTIQEYSATSSDEFEGLDMVVLVDRNSASASEIVAAALQDNGRAAVVGERSYGKGTVQQLIPIRSGKGTLKLTSASYWRPSGVNIHRAPNTLETEAWGVMPDVGNEVPLSEEEQIKWFEWRQQRDLVPENEVASENESESKKLEPAIETDAALARAVELLEK